MIELLVQFGADLKVVDGDSKTALMTAAANPNSFKLPPKRLCPPIYEVRYFINFCFLLLLIISDKIRTKHSAKR